MTTLVDAIELRLRNPSLRLAFAVLFGFLVIAGAILGPTVIKDGVENFQEIKRIQSRDYAGPIETWIRPWMIQNANTMIDALGALDWRVVDFKFGPCSKNNLRQLPNRDLRDVIDQSCQDLSRIQNAHGGECFTVSECNITEATKDEIRLVIANLDEAFSGLGLAIPYEVDEQGTIP